MSQQYFSPHARATDGGECLLPRLPPFLDALQIGVCVVGGDMLVASSNGCLDSMLGLVAGTASGRAIPELVPPSAAAEIALMVGAALGGGVPAAVEVPLSLPGGTQRVLLASARPVAGIPNLPPAALVSVEDVTDRRASEAARRECEDNWRYAMELSPDIVWVADRNGSILEVGSRWREMVGMAREETLGDGWMSAVHPDDLLPTAEAWRRCLSAGEPFDTEYRLRLADGSFRWMRARGAPRFAQDGTPERWYGTLVDVHIRRSALDRVAHMARHDSLTGLPNRMLFGERLSEDLQHGGDEVGVGVVLLDLDHFKAVNDTLGHSAGDVLLIQVAERLTECVRGSDTVARLGGDEFAVLQVGVHSPAAAVALAGRIGRAISAPFNIDGRMVSVGASVGVSFAPAHGRLPEELLKKADIALYRAKAAGRGTFSLFEPEMEAALIERQAMLEGLRSALAGGQLELHYQPIVAINNGMATCFEALLRWRRPGVGLVCPSDFIPVAEESGLIVPIGEWVLAEACREAATWHGDLRVAVNLSPVQFGSSGLVAAVDRALAASGLAPSRLELEITESTMLKDDAACEATLHELRRLGVRIALDDFGTGYSALGYLRRFPFDKLKLDRSFVTDLPTREDDRAIVRAVSEMCRALGISPVAEGVENCEQMRALRTEGFREVQGYLFSRPVPAADVPGLLRLLTPPS